MKAKFIVKSPKLNVLFHLFFSKNSIDFKSAQLFEGMCCVVDK